MSLRRKRADLGIRANLERKLEDYDDNEWLFFTSSPIKFLSCFMWHFYFYFEGYKSTPVCKNKPRPHSTISTFNTRSWPSLLLTFCGSVWNFVFFSVGISLCLKYLTVFQEQWVGHHYTVMEGRCVCFWELSLIYWWKWVVILSQSFTLV